MSAPRRIPTGTFKVLVERGSRFMKILEIEGPVGEYSDEELFLHFGGDPERSRMSRYRSDPTKGAVYAWED